MTVRRFFLSVVMVLWFGSALVVAPRALAQDPSRTSQLKISVWPEYDKPSVLVMYDGTLADGSNLPREISVLIPASASEPVTTYENNDGTFAAEQPFQSADAGNGYRQIRYTIKSTRYHVEYYDDLLRGSPDKTLEYNFKAFAPVDAVILAVQQPLKATNFAVFPAFDGSQDENGFQVYTRQWSGLTAGQILSARVTYTKGDSVPSVTDTGATGLSAGANVPAKASGGSTATFAVIAVVTIAALAVIGFLVYQRREHTVAPAPAVQRARGSKPKRTGGVARNAGVGSRTPGATGAQFCTQCGRELRPDDTFCSQCGTKRRSLG